MGMPRLEASRSRPKCREARIAKGVEGMGGLSSNCRRASELIAELRNVRERLRKIAAQVLSGWQELWRRITVRTGQCVLGPAVGMGPYTVGPPVEKDL